MQNSIFLVEKILQIVTYYYNLKQNLFHLIITYVQVREVSGVCVCEKSAGSAG